MSEIIKTVDTVCLNLLKASEKPPDELLEEGKSRKICVRNILTENGAVNRSAPSPLQPINQNSPPEPAKKKARVASSEDPQKG